jgi:2OG-Fe(II) oxygenase superfamily
MSVTIQRNVFTESEVESIFKTIFQKENERRWSINKHFWDDAIQNKSPGVVSVFVIEGPLRAMIESKMKRFLKPGEQFRHVQYYEWNQLSQINWHNDNHINSAITVYLNENWDHNWGGLFCWKENDEKGNFIIPQFNTAIVVRGHPFHHVTLTSPYAPTRKTLQIWIDDPRAPRVSQSPPLEPVSEEP